MRTAIIVAGLAGAALARPAPTLTPAVRMNHHLTGLQEAQAHTLAAAPSASAAATTTPSTVIDTVVGTLADKEKAGELERMLDEKKIMLQRLETEKGISEAMDAGLKMKLMDENAPLAEEVRRLRGKEKRRDQIENLMEENERLFDLIVQQEDKEEDEDASPTASPTATATATATPVALAKRGDDDDDDEEEPEECNVKFWQAMLWYPALTQMGDCMQNGGHKEDYFP